MSAETTAEITDEQLTLLTLQALNNLGGVGSAPAITKEVLDKVQSTEEAKVDGDLRAGIERARSLAVDAQALVIVSGARYCLTPTGDAIVDLNPAAAEAAATMVEDGRGSGSGEAGGSGDGDDRVVVVVQGRSDGGVPLRTRLTSIGPPRSGSARL